MIGFAAGIALAAALAGCSHAPRSASDCGWHYKGGAGLLGLAARGLTAKTRTGFQSWRGRFVTEPPSSQRMLVFKHTRLWENAWDEAADALCFPARQLGCRIDRLTRAA